MIESVAVRDCAFAIVDVFAERPLAGNPLAVVPDADALDAGLMASIAREFNQSETTFLLAPSVAGADWRLRCFTPSGAEVFGAGHNALGAWWWLAAKGRLDPGRARYRQQLGAGVLAVSIRWAEGRPRCVAMMQSPPAPGRVFEDQQRLAAALGLAPAELAARPPAQVVSTGAAHLLVPLAGRAAVERVRPDAQALRALLRDAGGQGCYVFSLDGVDPAASAHARFFNPTVGIAEDPATGSAAGPLACQLAAHGLVAPDATVIVEQGHALGRPSRIEVRLGGEGPEVLGGAVVVAEGRLLLG